MESLESLSNSTKGQLVRSYYACRTAEQLESFLRDVSGAYGTSSETLEEFIEENRDKIPLY